MQKTKVITLVLLVIAAALQIINIAGAGYSKTVFSILDDLHPPTKGEPSHIESNKGNTDFVIVSSVYSIIAYSYLIFVKATNRTISKTFDWLANLLAICFQFTIVVTFGNFITNNQVRFATAKKNLDDLLAAIPLLPAGSIVPDSTPYSNVFVLKSLCIAALVLSLLFCVGGSFFTFYMENIEESNSNDQKAIAEKSEITEGSQIN